MIKKLSAIGNSYGFIIERPILELLKIDQDTAALKLASRGLARDPAGVFNLAFPHQSALTSAEGFYAQGETAFNANSFATAHARFISAYAQARPCADDSFGTNAQGLEGGGCSP